MLLSSGLLKYSRTSLFKELKTLSVKFRRRVLKKSVESVICFGFGVMCFMIVILNSSAMDKTSITAEHNS